MKNYLQIKVRFQTYSDFELKSLLEVAVPVHHLLDDRLFPSYLAAYESSNEIILPPPASEATVGPAVWASVLEAATRSEGVCLVKVERASGSAPRSNKI